MTASHHDPAFNFQRSIEPSIEQGGGDQQVKYNQGDKLGKITKGRMTMPGTAKNNDAKLQDDFMVLVDLDSARDQQSERELIPKR